MASIIKNPPRIQTLFERGFELRNDVGYKYEKLEPPAGWHQEPAPCPDGVVRPHWHASALAGCPRQQMLKRAKLPSDGRPLNSEITFSFGNTVHALLEEFSSATVEETSLPSLVFDGRIQHIGAETGGCLHPGQDLALKARADWVFGIDDEFAIQDLKSEGTHLFRVDAAKESGAKDLAKDEHKLQIACNAIIQEGRGLVPKPVKYGVVTYCSKLAAKDRQGRAYSKNEWKFDDQWFLITDELRERVYHKIDELNDAWEQFETDGTLPDRLPDQLMPWGTLSTHFLCTPRGKDDDRGKYCEMRSVCFSLPTSDSEDPDSL